MLENIEIANSKISSASLTMTSFSKYIVYVDEAGDHGPVSNEFPVFVLAFCIFEKEAYAREVTTAITRLKFKIFGHDAVVLHERDIRKERGPFTLLRNREKRETFLIEVTELVKAAPFTLVAAVIEKGKLAEKYTRPMNPYHLAMEFGLERLAYFLEEKHDAGSLSVAFESRGRQEDKDLELEFRRVCTNNARDRLFNFEPVFAAKSANHAGLEIADLVARPIGIHVMRPTQKNRAYEVICDKFRKDSDGNPRSRGLKCFP
jgi:hypothetical protein